MRGGKKVPDPEAQNLKSWRHPALCPLRVPERLHPQVVPPGVVQSMDVSRGVGALGQWEG